MSEKSNSIRVETKEVTIYPWVIVAEFEDGQLLLNEDDFVRLINLKENREKIKFLHYFYGKQYRGTIDLSDKSLRLILVKRVKNIITEHGIILNNKVTYLVGWQTTVNGKNVKCILELHEDGSLILKNHDGRN